MNFLKLKSNLEVEVEALEVAKKTQKERMQKDNEFVFDWFTEQHVIRKLWYDSDKP